MKKIKDMVFFAKEDTEGIKLSSTSANYIANLAKEYIQGIEMSLNNVSFIDIDVTLVGTNTCNVIQKGAVKESLDMIPSMLENVAQAKSLIAWLREAIKAKEKLLNGVQAVTLDEWCKASGIEKPESPVLSDILTEEEYYDSLSIKERNRYYQLETVAAVLGKYIHPDGPLSKERKRLKDKMQHPNEVNGTGRDALIYSYSPSVLVDDVDDTFYELQKRHREVQAQLNSMKHDCKLAIEASTNKANSEYTVALSEYREAFRSVMHSFKTWKDTMSQDYSRLKIAIPNSLLEIYNLVNSLGK